MPKQNFNKPKVQSQPSAKKPYVNPNTEFFKLSALTNLLNAGLLIIILIVMLYMLYAQAAEQAYIRATTNALLDVLQVVK